MLKRSFSHIITLLLVLALGNDGLLLWQQGWVVLEQTLRSVCLRPEG